MPSTDEFLGLNIPEVLDDLRGLARKQIPFALVLALTLTARDGRDALRKRADDVFEIRRRWVINQIRTRSATKRSPRARVYATEAAAFLTEHVQGARKKRPRTAIPRRVRSSRSRVVPRKKWPGASLRDPRVYAARLPSGAIGIYRRMGKGGSRSRLLWIIEDQVKVKPRLRSRETVEREAGRRWPRNVAIALDKALKTARS